MRQIRCQEGVVLQQAAAGDGWMGSRAAEPQISEDDQMDNTAAPAVCKQAVVRYSPTVKYLPDQTVSRVLDHSLERPGTEKTKRLLVQAGKCGN